MGNHEAAGNLGAAFGLTRDNFILNPVEDYDCFARSDVTTRKFAESLDIDVVTGLAPKRLLYGPYGGGKTHTLMATMKELGAITKIHPVRIECPDLTKKSRFHDLYRDGIMRGLGQKFVLGLMDKVQQKVPMGKIEEMLGHLTDWYGDEEIARAASRLYDFSRSASLRLKLWRWLSSVPMSRVDLDDLGLSQDLTQAEAARLADVIVTLGRILRKLDGGTLVLILDEMERLRAISVETSTTFISGFARLVDPNQRDVAVLIGASAQVLNDLGEIFSLGTPVVSRLGEENIEEIPALEPADVDPFVSGVIGFLRKTEFDVGKAIDTAQGTINEKFESEFFPFSTEALDAIKSALQLLTPRAITMQMTRALGRAHRKGAAVVTSDCVAQG